MSGLQLEEFFRINIFEPLVWQVLCCCVIEWQAMNDTFFQVPDEKISRFCCCYAANPQTIQPIAAPQHYSVANTSPQDGWKALQFSRLTKI